MIPESEICEERKTVMKIRGILRKALSLMVLIGMTLFILTGCSGSKEDGGHTVYKDIKTAFDQSGLLSANIGIFSKIEKEGSIAYGECADARVYHEYRNEIRKHSGS